MNKDREQNYGPDTTWATRQGRKESVVRRSMWGLDDERSVMDQKPNGESNHDDRDFMQVVKSAIERGDDRALARLVYESRVDPFN